MEGWGGWQKGNEDIQVGGAAAADQCAEWAQEGVGWPQAGS